ncbi:MAG: DUF349 domain-containing protein [Gammaproteobacteria bacterium]|nr:DUF349 domain-containing protein [Gammaproteobacteria bacterium]
MFFRRSKNRLDSELPEERLSAIAEIDEDKAPKFKEQLSRCATSDPDLRVRKAALTWVDDQALLVAMLDDATIDEAAATRLTALGRAPNHPVMSRHLMRSATCLDDALNFMEQASDVSLRAELFCASPEEFREGLIKAICLTGEAGLGALEKLSRNRDKHCNRLARDELERLRKLTKDVDDDRRRAEELAEALGKVTSGDPRQRLEHLKRELEATISRLQTSAQALANYGLDAPQIHDYAALVAAAEAAAAEAAAAKPAANEDLAFAAMVTEFERLDAALLEVSEADGFAAIEVAQQELTERWRAAADKEAPKPDQLQIFERVCQRCEELAGALERMRRMDSSTVTIPNLDPLPDDPSALQALWVAQRKMMSDRKALQAARKTLNWPDWAHAFSETVRLEERAEALTVAIDRLDEHRANLQDTFTDVVAAIAGCVEEGQLQPALSALGQARRLEKSLPDRAAPEQRHALLREAARIEELKDWQNFATSPKREPLIQALESMLETPLDPKVQAEKIKALRSEWNALGPVTRHQDKALASRFNTLAEQAFEPCREYFSDQAMHRKQNLVEHQRICNQLEQYVSSVDWVTTDMQAAEQIMRTARHEWREYHPVDRNRGKTLEQRFEALQRQIHGRVKQAWENNLERKRQIVAEAQELAAGETATNTKVEGAKSLQRRWREVGMTPRKPDQQLWREFRRHCDAIFAARNVDKEQANQQIESAIAQAESICDALEAALNQTPADKALLNRLRGELNAVRLPERRERALHKRFDDLARNYNQLLLQQEAAASIAEIKQIKAWDRDVSQAEVAGQAIDAPAPIFSARVELDEEPFDELARLTLQAEILAGIESPERDRQVRLEVQVAALNESMGQRGAAKEPMDLVESWCCLSPKSSACDELRERFFRAVVELIRSG